MKVLVIPDVHLKPWIFSAASDVMQSENADAAVCLMDIADDWHRELDMDLYVETYASAIRFEQKHPGTYWCWGNHDLAYLWDLGVTGHSPMMTTAVNVALEQLRETLPDESRLAYVHRIDNVLFSHGGLSNGFVQRYVPECLWKNADAVLKRVNALGPEEMWRDSSPIWLRPQGNEAVLYGRDSLVQAVGHTPVFGVSLTRGLFSCDVFSTNRKGIPYGDQSFLLLDTVTLEYRVVR